MKRFLVAVAAMSVIAFSASAYNPPINGEGQPTNGQYNQYGFPYPFPGYPFVQPQQNQPSENHSKERKGSMAQKQ